MAKTKRSSESPARRGLRLRPAKPFPETPLDAAIASARYRGPRRSQRAMEQAVLREARKRRSSDDPK